MVTAPPDVLELAAKGVDSQDVISMIRAVAQTEIDYYHPRIAVWEPLLEPSNICFMVEWQPGSSKHPAQLAVEASDRFMDSGIKTEQSQTMPAISRVISLNLTDAAAEVLVRTNNEWKDWRQRSLVRQAMESHGSGNMESQGMEESVSHAASDIFPLSPTAQSESTVVSFSKIPDRFDAAKAKHIAAQKAAKAALIFAQKARCRDETEDRISQAVCIQEPHRNVTFIYATRTEQWTIKRTARSTHEPNKRHYSDFSCRWRRCSLSHGVHQSGPTAKR